MLVEMLMNLLGFNETPTYFSITMRRILRRKKYPNPEGNCGLCIANIFVAYFCQLFFDIFFLGWMLIFLSLLGAILFVLLIFDLLTCECGKFFCWGKNLETVTESTSYGTLNHEQKANNDSTKTDDYINIPIAADLQRVDVNTHHSFPTAPSVNDF